jgi:hypothetical protein
MTGGKKRSQGLYTGAAPTVAAHQTSRGMKAVSDGPTGPQGSAGNPGGGMGVKSGNAGKMKNGGDASGFAAGHAKMRSGKNRASAGRPQSL